MASGDLVDQRRRYQERESDAERYTGFHKSDEERHRRTGAERCRDPEKGGYHVTHPFVTSRHPFLHFLRGDVRPNDGDRKDDHREHQRDLDRVVDKEVHGRCKGAALHQSEDRIGHPVGELL